MVKYPLLLACTLLMLALGVAQAVPARRPYEPPPPEPEIYDFRDSHWFGKTYEMKDWLIVFHADGTVTNTDNGNIHKNSGTWKATGNTIYFDSDRDGHFNLYAYEVPSGKTSQVTFNKTWDVRWPSSDNQSRIVYELDGEIHLFDTKSNKDNAVSISVPDDGLHKRPSRISVAGNIEDASLSPKGERVLFCARGDIFTAPVEHGPTRNLTNTSGAHDKWPRWSPDGSRIAFISDKSGEEEVWIVAQDKRRIWHYFSIFDRSDKDHPRTAAFVW